MFHITPPRTSRCPVSCSLIGCRSLPMCFSVRTHFTQQDFWIADIQIVCLIIHTAWFVTRVNEHRFVSLISGICWRFCKICRRVKIGVKIVQSELCVSVLRNSHESVSLSTLKLSFFHSYCYRIVKSILSLFTSKPLRSTLQVHIQYN